MDGPMIIILHLQLVLVFSEIFCNFFIVSKRNGSRRPLFKGNMVFIVDHRMVRCLERYMHNPLNIWIDKISFHCFVHELHPHSQLIEYYIVQNFGMATSWLRLLVITWFTTSFSHRVASVIVLPVVCWQQMGVENLWKQLAIMQKLEVQKLVMLCFQKPHRCWV